MKKILIATSNPSKLEKYRKIFTSIADDVIDLKEQKIIKKPIESGTTAEENSQIKALYYAKLSGLPAFAEDEALYVDFLPIDQQPGVHVRRINGIDEVEDATILKYWENIVANTPIEKRTGKWHFAYCIAFPSGEFKVASADYPRVFFSPSSKIRFPGWPLSSIQGPAKFNKPHSELTEKESRIMIEEKIQTISECLKALF